MKESIDLKWLDKMAFETEVNGHRIVVDAKEEVGGTNQGPRPKPLMMVALAGCTAMDVISILNKMRIQVEEFHVKIEGDLTEEHPKYFTAMHIIYEFKGRDLPMDKLERAVQLSQENYCGVSASYKKAMNLTHEIRI
ncbi:MAG TPA: OsmC family protein [Bacteroidales bacterium]|nr:OsmC family protein [Bacteroidales bacterium]